MKITSITIYQIDLPLNAPFEQSGGRVVEVQDDTIVAIETDTGITGWGESCPWGANYLPAFAQGVRAAVAVLGEQLIGQDPASITAIRQRMDEIMTGQPAAKHAIETACWDILGKAANLPLCTLLGGRVSSHPMRQGLILFNQGRDAMREQILQARAEQRPNFELKMTGDVRRDIDLVHFVSDLLAPHEPLKIDANGAWTPMEARAVMSVAPHMNFQYEQPCTDLEQIRALRRLTDRPIYLDESALTLADVARAATEGLINGVNVKLARIGGLSQARAMRDLCVGLGLPVIVQCTGGSEISAAAIAHMAHSTPPRSLVSVWNPAALSAIEVASGLASSPDEAGLRAGDQPGLGLTVDTGILGAPHHVIDGAC